MSELEHFGLHANTWQFLLAPDTYVEASLDSSRPLLLASTRRQFATARSILERLNGSQGEPARKGTLLADDVGLGKTTVAALVAWVAAGKEKSVRILAPNAVMTRRWAEELRTHVPLLKSCAPHLRCSLKQVRADRVGRLTAGTIQVTTHSWASKGNTLSCDLLIVDEAHRAKGEGTSFSKALREQSGLAARALILTATPLSIDADELQRMMDLVGAEETERAIRSYSRALHKFYTQSPSAPAEHMASKLADHAEAATTALAPFVIRHSVADLPQEKESFGRQDSWLLTVPPISGPDLELLLRMDRVSRVTRHEREDARLQTNDVRYHVGWQHLRGEAAALRTWLNAGTRIDEVVTDKQLSRIEKLSGALDAHPKMQAVANAVREIVDSGEKVLLFCFHYATAQELTKTLLAALPPANNKQRASLPNWRAAWTVVLESCKLDDEPPCDLKQLRGTFVEWMCTQAMRRQVEAWIDPRRELGKSSLVVDALEQTTARGGRVTIAESGRELFAHLVASGSRSTQGVLRSAHAQPEKIHGADGLRAFGVCEPPAADEDHAGFLGSKQPDFTIAVFNSPFGPDALVATDRLSEGIDLHRCCRHLVHYELSASPIRTIQRN
ncbi:MAG: helicase, partial [Myxococcaceae bacterium]|nr:helicase [Myxococcaceae bacterium]